MRTIKGACCPLIGVGIIIATFVSAIAEGDPVAWVIPAGVTLGLLPLWLAKVGRAHPSERPRSVASYYRVYAYGMVGLSVLMSVVFLYVAVTSDIIHTPIGPLYLLIIGLGIEFFIIITVHAFASVTRHDDYDKQIKVLREIKEERSKVDAPYDMIAFELEKVARIQKEHLTKEIINDMQIRDGVSYLHTRFCKRS